MNTKFRALALALMASSAALGMASCSSLPEVRQVVAHNIASPAWLVERQIAAAPFSITAFERMHDHNAPADVYIEGDGLAWTSRNEASLDPTPTNPVALNLAAMDKARNVGYLARPCQFSKMLDKNTACPAKYWTSQRFAPEVIDAMNAALDNMKAIYDITEFNLIGFSGGANVAALLAERRTDVASLRTVAGNLDHKTHSEFHKVSYLENSLNAIDDARKLADTPQRHFIGGQDKIVPPILSAKFVQAVGSDRCADITLIQEASHEESWADKWPELLKMPVACKTPKAEPELVPYMPPKKVEREKPEKP
jgi:hypothetical protein